MKSFVCCNCEKQGLKSTGHVNRALKLNKRLFCNKQCHYEFYRKNKKSLVQRKEEKRLYDIEYRRKNLAEIKAKKAIYMKKDYDANPEKYRARRKTKQPKHNEYCRRPEYRKYKKEYDQEYRNKKMYGEFWEAGVMLTKLDNFIETKMSNYEIRLKNKTLNKALQRSRNANIKRGYT